MTPRRLKGILQPPGVAIPAAELGPSRRSARLQGTAAVAAAGQEPLAVSAQLSAGMPGVWPAPTVQLAEQSAVAYRAGRAPAPPFTSAVTVELLEALALDTSLSVVDPFADHGAVAAGLRARGLTRTAGAASPASTRSRWRSTPGWHAAGP
jgi:hypothetical protein